ncbi:Protein pangolin isoform A/H/I/S [Taenia solium]|eukprot:TsM_000785700 transcript=TsM_000785700 gene=TsM_000785700
MNSVAGDDLACTDEIKVYEDEGEEDEQVKSSENLTEDKVGLVIESEEQSASVLGEVRGKSSISGEGPECDIRAFMDARIPTLNVVVIHVFVSAVHM